jgi:O-antigen/teichoic acid export membrane protein
MTTHEPNRIAAVVRRLRASLLVHNTVAMLVGSGTRLLIQGIYFVLIARALGAEQYGAFVGVVALVAILSPFASFGTGPILIRNVARDRKTFRYSWGNALWMISISGSALLGGVLLLAKFIMAGKVPLTLVFLVGLSDMLLAAIVALASQAFQAVEQLRRTAQVQIVLTGARAAAAVILILAVRHPTALSWGFFYCLSSAVGALYAIVLVCSRLGYPALSLRHLRDDLREGFYFAIGLSSATIYNDIDKAMLVRLATLGATGIYAAAYRLIDLSFQPVAALVYSAYPRFFKRGRQGLSGTTAFAKQLLPFATVYAVFAGAVLVLFAPVVPLVLGRDFGQSEGALRWLSPLVLFRAVHYFLADSLTGAGLQGLRSAIQVLVAGLNLGLDLWLIPNYSWRGAAWASLASEGTLVVGMFAATVVVTHKRAISEAACKAEPTVTS